MLKNTECEYELQKDIKLLSSIRISTLVNAIAYPKSEDELINLIRALDENSVPFLTVGKMSNILFRKPIYEGVLISTQKIKIKTEAENKITLSCGETLVDSIRLMAERNLGGLEGLFGIPGTVGGMVRQNAGAFGYEIADRFLRARCYVRSEDSVRTFKKEDMRFSYRDSILLDKDIILIDATFEFLPKKRYDIFSEIKEYGYRRRNTQPIEFPSLGSVFKRCSGTGAGYYIDKAGLKGYSIGGAKISDKHAGFIVNMGDATAKDFLSLVDYVKHRVYTSFGIELKEEIEII